MVKAIGGGEGPHQVDVYVGETALLDRNRLCADLKMAMDFLPLAGGAFSPPGGDFFAQSWPDEPRRNGPTSGKSAWVGNAVKVLKHRLAVLRRYQRSPHPRGAVTCQSVTLNVLTQF